MPLDTRTRSSSGRLIGALLVSACLVLPAAAQQAGSSDKGVPIDPGSVTKSASPDGATAKTGDQSTSSEPSKAGEPSGSGDASKASGSQKTGENADANSKTGAAKSGTESGGKAASSSGPQDQRASDAQAFFQAQLAALHAGLTLTADQEALWSPVDSAIRDLHQSRSGMRNREQLRDLLKETPSYLLRMRSEQLVQRGNAIKALVDATGPLLDKLDDMQKRRLPLLLVGMRPSRILRAAFDIRYGRVMNDPDDDATPKASQRDDHGSSGSDEADEGDGGMHRHHRRMQTQDYGRGQGYGQGGDDREGASYDGRGNPQAMQGRHSDISDD